MTSASTVDMNQHDVTVLPPPIQGRADWRAFRALQLPNGVQLVLVHDEQAKTTAAAACVAAGAAADPREMSGLAHFCEHMCFLGSERYPGENDYKKYLSQHGGRSNASTSLHATTYKFDVLAEHAEHALDLFAAFFTCPTMSVDGTIREVNAVDSENSKNLTADSRRRLQVLKALADPTHYFSKFTTGNARTLPMTDDNRIREALLCFHRYHYRPDNLVVVVAGPQPLDTLQAWTVPKFASMTAARDFADNVDTMNEMERLIYTAAQDAPPYKHDDADAMFRSAFLPRCQNDTWPVSVTTKPLRSMRVVTLLFPMPSIHKTKDQSPVHIISHLLGHEGPHSSFAALQNAGLVTALSSGLRMDAPDYSVLSVELTLTDVGEARWKEAVDVVFQHCRLLQTAMTLQPDELRRIWAESAELARLFFHQSSPGHVYDLAPNLARSMLTEGSAQCLCAGSMLQENASTFPLDRVEDFVEYLTASNCIIERCSDAAWAEMEELEQKRSGGVERKTEQWYSIEYFVAPMDANDVERWEGRATPFFQSPDLQLPRPNKFIPKKLELCADLPDEAQTPRIDKRVEPPNLLVDDLSSGRLWHRLDDRYALPKSILTLFIRNAAVTHVADSNGIWRYDASAAAHASILSAMFADAMAQETYDAHLAGLGWSLTLTDGGIQLFCSGFSDRLADLALKVLRAFVTQDEFATERYFDAAKDRLLRRLRSYLQSGRADAHALYYRDLMVGTNEISIADSIKATEETSIETIKAYYQRIWKNEETTFDCLFTGNVSEAVAKMFFKMATFFINQVRSTPTTTKAHMWTPGTSERRLQPGQDVELHFASENPQEENGGLVVTYQSHIPSYRGEGLSESESLDSTAALRLLSSILREPLFDELRTKQTLGYIVSSYFDTGVSVRPATQADLGSQSIPVDYLTISVLSRKVAPPELQQRVDDFLHTFRQSLAHMPESEVRDYAHALSTKLLKPFQKLSEEATNQFSKIRRYAPEVLASMATHEKGVSNGDVVTMHKKMPWDSVEPLAAKIRDLRRQDLLDSWDRLISPHSRARIVSCVYGSTFPLVPAKVASTAPTVIVNNVQQLLHSHQQWPIYDHTSSPRPPPPPSTRLVEMLMANKKALGAVAIGLVGCGVVGLVVMNRSAKRR